MNDTITQYLTFTLNKDSYAIDVRKVREILEMVPITPLPRAPEYLRGVINVRGSVVPVVDLRQKLGMPSAEATTDTCIVVLDVSSEDKAVTAGALVDAVQEVIELGSASIEHPPRIGTAVASRHITGIGKRDDRFIMLLDISSIFTGEELAAAEKAGALNAAP